MILDAVHIIPELSERLYRYRAHWQFKPFEHQLLPFDEALSTWLWAQSDANIERLNTDVAYADDCLAPWFAEPIQWRKELEQQLLAAAGKTLKPIPFWLANGISGRKLAQISAFTSQLPPWHGVQLEWCAGKGHLGRLLHYETGQPVRSLEWQPQLCVAGQELADKYAFDQSFICEDALSRAAAAQFHQVSTALTLHACGDLHTQLIRHVVATKVRQLQLVPCCYQLQQATVYQPLSKVAAAAKLNLSRFDLKLAVQGQMTGGERIRGLREREIQWRLGYENWRRTRTGCDVYRPLGTFAKAMLNGSFADFVRWAAEQHQLTTKGLEQTDLQQYERAGVQHWRAVQRMDAIRRVFGRLLEIWLVLDRAAWLQEANYSVALLLRTTTDPEKPLYTGATWGTHEIRLL